MNQEKQEQIKETGTIELDAIKVFTIIGEIVIQNLQNTTIYCHNLQK